MPPDGVTPDESPPNRVPPGAAGAARAAGGAGAAGAVGSHVTRQPDGAAAELRVEEMAVDFGGRRVLEGVNLVLAAGETIAITGPSGSGKTVLCLVLGRALRPTRGTVRLDRYASEVPIESPSSMGPTEAALTADGAYSAGLILQTHGLVAGLTAEENVALPLQARRLPREDVAARTARALADVGLERHAGRPVDELSGGERQRVGIARALALDPEVLVADEPTSELDPGNRNRVLSLLRDLARRGRIVAIASDDPEVAAACSRVVVLDQGTVLEYGTTLGARR